MDRSVQREDSASLGRFDRFWPLLFVVFLPNMAPPLTMLFRDHPSAPRLGAILTGAALFVAMYLRIAWQSELGRTARGAPPFEGAWRWIPVAALTALSVAMILGDGPRWLSLVIFTSAAAGGRLPLGQATRTVAALAVLAASLGWIGGDTVSDLGVAAFWTFMAGLLTIILSHLRRTNAALREAREEIARLAVETERLRFARDLHDLLGHDLARIALQSEVAEALVSTAPDRAMAAMRDVGEAARTALRQVRAAVAGYRQPTLASERRGAEEILAAAGISCRYEGARVAMPLAAETTLAWTVREGVTNVVKHSRARHCTIRLTHDDHEVGVEVIDDGDRRGSGPRIMHGGLGARRQRPARSHGAGPPL